MKKSLLIFIVFLASCSQRVDYDASLKVSICHLETIYECDPESINLDSMTRQYGYFWDVYSEHIIPLPKGLDFADSLRVFQENKDYNEVYQSLKLVFQNIESVDDEITKAIQRYNYYFPNRLIPKVVTFYGGFNYPVVATDSVIGIGLDMFLGKNVDYYKQLEEKYPLYMHQQFQPEYMLPVALKGWLDLEFPGVKNNFLSQMVHAGRIQYVLSHLLPEESDSILMGYSSSDIDWCEASEVSIWKFLIEEELLYSNSHESIVKYLYPAPYSGRMPQESPGRVGVWVGWQIVKSYLYYYPETTLEELMAIKDAQYLLKKSKYKP